MCLHLVYRSAQQSAALNSCLAMLQPEDALLLLGDGVYAVLELGPSLPSCYVLADDWQLRAPQQALPSGVTAIDYPRWVELALAHKQSMTWV